MSLEETETILLVVSWIFGMAVLWRLMFGRENRS